MHRNVFRLFCAKAFYQCRATESNSRSVGTNLTFWAKRRIEPRIKLLTYPMISGCATYYATFAVLIIIYKKNMLKLFVPKGLMVIMVLYVRAPWLVDNTIKDVKKGPIFARNLKEWKTDNKRMYTTEQKCS